MTHHGCMESCFLTAYVATLYPAWACENCGFPLRTSVSSGVEIYWEIDMAGDFGVLLMIG